MESIIGLPVLLGFFLIAVVLGAVISRTNFCTMGAVSDWVNIGDTGRLSAWLLAIAVAVLFSTTIEALSTLSLEGTRPPYRSVVFTWPRYILGGIMFGVGMALSGGCVSKNLVRFGGGNLKSLVILAIASVFAYFMTKTAFFEIVFYSWIHPVSIDLSAMGAENQDFGAFFAAIFSYDNVGIVRIILAVILIVAIQQFAIRTSAFKRSNNKNLISGIVVGFAVFAGWLLTGGSLGAEWAEAAEWADNPPVGIGVQSYTFVNPMGEVLTLLLDLRNASVLITVGVLAAVGLIVGSLIDAVISRNFRIAWFASFRDFASSSIGAVLMGIGGVLALGCSIGQGVTGVSTLAIGSFIALISMVFGCATTLKVQYYRIMYEDAGFLDAILSSWVDFKLIPKSLRKFESL